jgi:glycosyltransferase involved in cell wall biosynthesis
MRRPRVLVVSHACVVSANQAVYLSLCELGWDLHVVVPSRWRHEYAGRAFAPQAWPGLEDRLLPRRVLFPGLVQRHLYAGGIRRLLDDLQPDVAFLEEETFSLPASQWAFALARGGIPYGLQAAENLDRRLHPVARAAQRHALSKAAFVAARSPRAAELIAAVAPDVPRELIPHAVPPWEQRAPQPRDAFTVGFAGRLVEEKGLRDLLAAVRGMEPPVELYVAGNGPLREELEAADDPGRGLRVHVETDISHEEMAAAYARMDVLAVPSLTTPRWAEQFGRVLVEAMGCGRPVVGSSSGEIPWVIDVTGGGRVFPEGDAQALRAQLEQLRADPGLRRRLADDGRSRALELFSVDAVARTLATTLERVIER